MDLQAFLPRVRKKLNEQHNTITRKNPCRFFSFFFILNSNSCLQLDHTDLSNSIIRSHPKYSLYHNINNAYIYTTLPLYASDHFTLLTLLTALKEFGVLLKLVRLIMLTLTDTNSRVRVDAQMSEKSTIKRGGNVLSPVLFKQVLENLCIKQ